MRFEPITEAHYCFHGVDILFECSDPRLHRCVHRFLRPWARPAYSPDQPLRITWHPVKTYSDIPFTIPDSAQFTFRYPAIPAHRERWLRETYKDQDVTIHDYRDHGRTIIDTSQESAIGYVVIPETENSIIPEVMFHDILTRLLRTKGFYTIHAAAAEKDGVGVVIMGPSGTGKTTSYLSLLLAGFNGVSDDFPLLRCQQEGMELMALAERVEVNINAFDVFPAWQPRTEEVLKIGPMKDFFYLEDLFPHQSARSCIPKILLFPQQAETEFTHCGLMSKQEALAATLPRFRTPKDVEGLKAKSFDLAVQLVKQVDSYRVEFGRNVEELEKVISPLIAQKQKSSSSH